MTQRPPSPRPTVLVDEAGRPLDLGLPGPLGRERVVACLPFADGPRQLAPMTLILAPDGEPVMAGGAYLGRAPVWVSRILSADVVSSTRRL